MAESGGGGGRVTRGISRQIHSHASLVQWRYPAIIVFKMLYIESILVADCIGEIYILEIIYNL